MKIAIIGLGGIGSTFAFQLSRAGHEVTVVARSKRLEQLQQAQAIETVTGERAPVQISAALDTTTAWDLVLVTVLAAQVDEVLPVLVASAAKKIMFMFNTFEPLSRLQIAVGSARFAFGFPAILASIEAGKLKTKIVKRGQTTIATDASWAQLFSAAGIPTAVEAEMESWLRTHAALAAPFMVISHLAYQRHSGITWGEASQAASAMQEGFALVRQLQNRITPTAMSLVSALPKGIIAALLWSLSRFAMTQTLGVAGPREPRALIDAMRAVATGPTPALLAIRP